jgi:hypothetical protein
MLGTALLIGGGLLVIVLCVVGLASGLELRLNRATRAREDGDHERAEALRGIARDINKGRSAGDGFF